LTLVGYLIASLTFLPSQFFNIPKSYSITEKGIVNERKRIILPKKNNKVQMNKGRSYVSILHRYRGEYLRLYTDNVEKVSDLVKKLYLNPPIKDSER
jgi:uncharacterized membrane protein